ncbi:MULTISPECIES: PTS galactosamine transporter subunit IIB [Tepidanaerobacter]|uniref:PTS galactosamine transporter subunit IIB n=1 Tax=Tepidanaerobacter TaxID=499228 RepID=UPI000B09772F|nr:MULTISPECIES: PTS galactosamine transporter subunit IIB [Tepidanaerobacter]GLI51190.1 N-acetylgalactosamine-specific phosphotransferase enzyme IIB component 1 [Tepidanaerobacter syntrophicus]
MTTPNIVFTRIDNRLVHGQVGNVWVRLTKANLIIVVDDEVAKDPLQQQLMKMTADSYGVGIRFFTVQQTIDTIFKASPKQHIFIVAKTPAVIRKLVEACVPIKQVNVGNMHFSEGKKPLTPYVYVDDKDLEDINYLKNKGIEVFAQTIPDDKKVIL